MQKIKKAIAIGLCSVLLIGCSGKHPAMKTGAIIGGVAGMTLGAIGGSEIGGTHNGPSSKAEGAVVLGVVFGLMGLGLGAGTGYIVDSISGNDDEMKEMIESQKVGF